MSCKWFHTCKQLLVLHKKLMSSALLFPCRTLGFSAHFLSLFLVISFRSSNSLTVVFPSSAFFFLSSHFSCPSDVSSSQMAVSVTSDVPFRKMMPTFPGAISVFRPSRKSKVLFFPIICILLNKQPPCWGLLHCLAEPLQKSKGNSDSRSSTFASDLFLS